VAHDKKIAIVCDWLIGGGAEKVVLALHELYPDAPIYTSYCSPEWRKKLNNKVVTGYLQNWPFSKLRKYLPLIRFWWFKNLNLRNYDIIISSAGNGEAKAIANLKKDAIHICYCHTPTHFYWEKYDEYVKNPGFGVFNFAARIGLKLLVHPLRKKDYYAAQKVDYFIANSHHIKQSIKKYYGKDSEVIHPPVDISRFNAIRKERSDTFVTIGRQTPYKRTDIIVRACSELNMPLMVLGYGPEHENLKKIAGTSVTFMHQPTNKQIDDVLAKCKAFIFAAKEDFGITPVEAIAAGLPVIAYKAGGALDYVDESVGLFFEEQTVESLKKAIQNFEQNKYDSKHLRSKAQLFSVESFKEKIQRFINQEVI
jgi:glycosyltransferase involved in cell wall biosynthesis